MIMGVCVVGAHDHGCTLSVYGTIIWYGLIGLSKAG